MTTTLTLAGRMSMTARELPPQIGARLQALRRAAGLSQQALAMRAGISMSVVFQIEQGKKKDPRLSTVAALAEGLGIPIGELATELTREEKEPGKKKGGK
jgi:transcriptional regulator with XRE-family HTH domain